MSWLKVTGTPPSTPVDQGAVIVKTGTRYLIRHRRHHHARPSHFPDMLPFTNNPDPPYKVAHQLQAFTHRNWKTGLSGAQRAAWNTQAAAVTVQIANGSIKTLTGMQLYIWYVKANYFWLNAVPLYIDEGYASLFNSPPATWSPPATPTAIATTGTTSLSIRFSYSSTPNLDTDNASCLISKKPKTGAKPPAATWCRANVGLSAISAPAGTYKTDIFFHPIAKTLEELRGALCRYRIMSDFPDLVPSNFAQFTLNF